MKHNDNTPLVPRVDFVGPTLRFDFSGFQIGVAEYEEGPTGCTVFYFPDGVETAVDVRGGWPGVSQEFDFSDAICFAGGSLVGLEAIWGVTVGIHKRLDYAVENGLPA